MSKPCPAGDDALLNAEPPCECGICDCSSPLIDPARPSQVIG
jgi:hypothetical protein